MSQDSASGVYYRREDYLGVAKRLLIDLVDLPVALVLSLAALSASSLVVPGLGDRPEALLLLSGGPCFAYLVLLKRSRFRTVGYRAAGAEIVGLDGERPSILQLTSRLLFAVAGPLNFILDVLWLGGEGDRQALRDKFAGTYVIRRGAVPAGGGPVVLRTYMFWGMAFMFKEVTRRPGPPSPAAVETMTTDVSAVEAAAPAAVPPTRLPRAVTLLLCGVCAAMYVAIALWAKSDSWDSLARWGYPPADRVWDGAYWGLVSSVFVHLTLWHVAFNVYWLWVLGNVVERELGAGRYVGFVLAAALVSSSLQLAASDTTGHGASGVVYALFGLMWASRRRVPAFAEALGDRTVPLFVIWLLGCIVATAAGVADIANAAHVGGLIFGWLAARWSFPGAPRRSLAIAGTGFLSLIALVPLFWSPWSSTWVGHQAYKAHLAGDYDRAAAGYRRCMSLGGDRAWALANLALVRHTQGAQADYEKALAELRAEDPAAADELEAELREPADDAATP